VQALYRCAEALLNEVQDEPSVSGLTGLKSHDNYTFQHSVDVAIFGAVLGKRMGLEHVLLRDLTLGCLLHDIGKTYIDERILNKPGALTDVEFAEVMRHPTLGFQMLSQVPMEGSRARHVVYQHHERQDGSGYPQRLFSSNRILRTQQERFDVRRMSLLGEICAVADVYSAMSSDRPYRAAMPPHRVVDVLQQMSGAHLNVEIVRTFIAGVQLYPVGSAVRIDGGTHAGGLGIVIRLNSLTLHRPVVRVLFDSNGKRLADDVEVDFRHEPETTRLNAIGDLEHSLDAYVGVDAA
jgi:HD-GYP domain-containing protein (c-di-GMP phosphodiesterase class II)